MSTLQKENLSRMKSPPKSLSKPAIKQSKQKSKPLTKLSTKPAAKQSAQSTRPVSPPVIVHDPNEKSKLFGQLCFFLGDRDGIKMNLLFLIAKSPRSVNELELASGLKASLISQHLSRLRNINFVDSVKLGQKRIYSISNRLHLDIKEMADYLEPRIVTEISDSPATNNL